MAKENAKDHMINDKVNAIIAKEERLPGGFHLVNYKVKRINDRNHVVNVIFQKENDKNPLLNDKVPE